MPQFLTTEAQPGPRRGWRGTRREYQIRHERDEQGLPSKERLVSSSADARPPWKQQNPKKRSKPLSTKQKSEARATARAAGRTYPNLVDNMAVARKKR